MSELTKVIGQRIRNCRTARGLSQERLAEAAGCHHTYIGQLERGEKNATIESLGKITKALNVPMTQLFEGLGNDSNEKSIPLECYELLAGKSKRDQEFLFHILLEIDAYKNTRY